MNTHTSFVRKLLATAVITSLLLVAPLSAKTVTNEPDWRAVPTYTTIDLRAGFTPDPWTYNLQAGGASQVDSSLGYDCTGYIHAVAPDVDLNYTAGSLNLYISVESSDDTSLIIYGPDRRWYCNDDTNGLNPVVVFTNPRSGNYNIWVGTYNSGGTRPATLKITEIDPRY